MCGTADLLSKVVNLTCTSVKVPRELMQIVLSQCLEIP